MIKRNTFVSVIKDLYYEQHRVLGLGHYADADGSTAFVNAMRAICDINSDAISESNPYWFPYSSLQQDRLYWRVILFRDELALFLLRENANKFFMDKTK